MFCQLPCKVRIYSASESVRLVRAPDCGSGGRRFETDLPPQKTKGLQQCSPFFMGAIQLFAIKANISPKNSVKNIKDPLNLLDSYESNK